MPPKKTAGLRCHECKEPLTVVQALDAARVSWPNQEWIAFDCPKCGKSMHGELGQKSLKIGELDGFPGPCFIASSRAPLVGVNVSWTDAGVEVKYGKKRKLIRAKV